MGTYERLRQLDKKRNSKGAALERAALRQTAVVEDLDPRKMRKTEKAASRFPLAIFFVVFALFFAASAVFVMVHGRAMNRDFQAQMDDLKVRLAESSQQLKSMEESLKKTASGLAGIEAKMEESVKTQREQYSRISELKLQVDAVDRHLNSLADPSKIHD